MKTDVYPEPGLDQDASVPTLGCSLHALMGTYGFDSPSFIPELEPPKAYDLILQNVAHCSPRTSRPLLTPWTRHALVYESNPPAQAVRIGQIVLDSSTRVYCVDPA